MLMTIYWYGVFAYILGIILIGVRILCDERWKSFLMADSSNSNDGNKTTLAIIRVIVSGIVPILHWLYAIVFVWIFLSDKEWHEVSDKVLGQYNDER